MGFPNSMKNSKHLAKRKQRGSMRWGRDVWLALQWKDNKPVTILTSIDSSYDVYIDKGSWYNQPQPTPQPSTSNETGKEIGASRLKIHSSKQENSEEEDSSATQLYSEVEFDDADSPNTLAVVKNHHTMEKGVRRGGPLMSIYLLDMLKDTSLTFSQLMRRVKEKKGGVKIAMMQAKSRRHVTFVLTVTLALVLLLISGSTISHRL
ncbi:hypothetical protein ACROYT_G040289 [Oculina patagonica]